jgi:hypothetical protein
MKQNCPYGKSCVIYMFTHALAVVMKSQLSHGTCLNFESVQCSLITSIKFPTVILSLMPWSTRFPTSRLEFFVCTTRNIFIIVIHNFT